MLQDITQLYGKKLGATDGDIGHVKDFYFDDQTWAVRYLVVDTGSWLFGRTVLLAHQALGNHAFGRSDADTNVLRVNLTRKRIEDSPSIDSHLPVSRQYEEEYHRYYGWSGYWQAGGMLGVAGFPVVTPPLPHHHGHNQQEDIHLRSTKAVAGYCVHSTDGPIGSVRSFIVDGKDWAIRELVVESGPWNSGQEILIVPGKIDRISYQDSTVFVNLTKADIQRESELAGVKAGAAGGRA